MRRVWLSSPWVQQIYDAKLAYLYSCISFNSAEPILCAKRWSAAECCKVVVTVPGAVYQHNRFIGGVVLTWWTKLSNYSIAVTFNKWWQSLIVPFVIINDRQSIGIIIWPKASKIAAIRSCSWLIGTSNLLSHSNRFREANTEDGGMSTVPVHVHHTMLDVVHRSAGHNPHQHDEYPIPCLREDC